MKIREILLLPIAMLFLIETSKGEDGPIETFPIVSNIFKVSSKKTEEKNPMSVKEDKDEIEEYDKELKLIADSMGEKIELIKTVNFSDEKIKNFPKRLKTLKGLLEKDVEDFISDYSDYLKLDAREVEVLVRSVKDGDNAFKLIKKEKRNRLVLIYTHFNGLYDIFFKLLEE